MITISLCMIVKNEERTLANCLNCVRGVVDEIVIVDTGSTDRTRQVAAAFTDRIFDFEWIDDFAAARNAAYARAAMDYILWLDADDILPPAEAVALRKLKAALPGEADAVMMRYATEFDPQGRPAFSYYRERLTKRARGFLWRESVHEYLDVSGVVLTSEITVFHATRKEEGGAAASGRNLRIYVRLIAGGEALSPRGM